MSISKDHGEKSLGKKRKKAGKTQKGVKLGKESAVKKKVWWKLENNGESY